jgi:ABC-type branched-subunit amino acid transport system permease subunit
MTSPSFTVSLFSFCLNDLSIGESGVLKSSTLIVWGSMCVLSFSKVSFMNVGAFAFGAQMLLVDFPLDEYKMSSSSCLLTVGLKSILLDIRMATPTCFLGTLLGIPFPYFYSEIVPIFVFEVCFLFSAKCWILFAIQSVSVCLFIHELSPLILRDIKES